MANLIQGTRGSNTLSARANSDTVEGLAGNDILTSSTRTGVYLYGGEGNDTLTAKASDARIDGGAGIDTVRFAGAVASLADDVLEDVEKIVITNTSAGAYIFSSQTEALNITGSNRVDSITGGSGDDTITGGVGNDSLNGGAGDDLIVAEAKDTAIVGGADNDTASFAAAVALADMTAGKLSGIENIIITNRGNAVYDFSAQSGSFNITGGRGSDTIITKTGTADKHTLRGGEGNDVFVAQSDDALVDGGAGNDTVKYAAGVSALTNDALTNVETVLITGTGGGTFNFSSQTEGLDISGNTDSDVIYGGTGSDALRGGGGEDTLYAADNDRLIDGGGGRDTVDFSAAVSAKNLANSELVNVEIITISNTGNAAYDFSVQTEKLSITGGTRNDTITGGLGVDTLNGDDGDDLIVASDTDMINGGDSGTDTVRFTAAVSKVNLEDVDLVNIDNIELVSTRAAAYDFSAQSEGLNITGSSSNDTITGGAAADQIRGGAGNDVLIATDDDTLIDGGAGSDAVWFGAEVTTGLTDEELVDVENVLLTTDDGADFSVQTESLQITGSSGTNSIKGGKGSDTITGAGGADRLYGKEGADVIIAESSDAEIDGDAGNDTVRFAAGVTWHNNDNWLVEVENVVITNTGNASYVFSDQTESLNITGGRGNDTITGGSAADTLSGGAGNDELVATEFDVIDGGAGTDTVKFGTAVTATNLLNADLVNVENVVITAAATVDLSAQTEALNVTGSSGVDSITGGAGADTLHGGSGNDVLVASASDALIDGGDGSDTVKFAAGFTATTLTNAKLINVEKVTITNTAADSYDFSAQTEALVITGSTVADTITGTQDWDSINGGVGNDVLSGGAGNDTLEGDDGDDLLTGGAGLDTYQVDSGTDTITDLAAGETLIVSSDATALVSGALLDLSQLASGTDNDGTVIITGTASGDTIKGTTGVDVITGGAGNDSITVGAGSSVSVSDVVVINAVVGTSSDSGRVTVSGNNNDTGGDTVTSFVFTKNTVRIVASNVTSFVHGTDTAVGTQTGGVDDGTVGSFLNTTGLVELNQTTNNDFDDDGDIAITFASVNFANDTSFEAVLQYNLTGTDAADTITTGGLDDTIDGGAGDDVLTGNAGVDTLVGNDGNDTFVYASMGDFVTSNAVVDSIVGGVGTADTIQVNAAISIETGNSLVRAVTVEQLVAQTQSANARSHSIVQGTDANLSSIRSIDLSGDTHTSSTGVIDLTGITGAVTNTTLKGVLAGNNTITGGAGVDSITGGNANDTITGGAGADVISGGNGNNLYIVAAAADLAVGESITGGTGTDTLYLSGAAVYDLTNLAAGRDNLVTEASIEKLIVKHTAVTLDEAISGTALAINTDGAVALTASITMTATTLDLSSITYTLIGDVSSATETALTAGDDKFSVTGTSGADTIRLSGLGDLVDGGGNADNITGGAGADTITGGAGADTITGGAGADQITTSSGADVIVLAASGDSTAPTAAVEAGTGADEKLTVTEAAGDVVTGDVSDTFDIVASGGAYTAVAATTVLVDGAIVTTTYATTGLDVFVYKDGTDYYLAYETTPGAAANFGALETVKLVGIVDANDTFAVDATGVVSFAAVA